MQRPKCPPRDGLWPSCLDLHWPGLLRAAAVQPLAFLRGLEARLGRIMRLGWAPSLHLVGADFHLPCWGDRSQAQSPPPSVTLLPRLVAEKGSHHPLGGWLVVVAAQPLPWQTGREASLWQIWRDRGLLSGSLLQRGGHTHPGELVMTGSLRKSGTSDCVATGLLPGLGLNRRAELVRGIPLHSRPTHRRPVVAAISKCFHGFEAVHTHGCVIPTTGL